MVVEIGSNLTTPQALRALADHERDEIENRASDLFREYQRKRGGTGPASLMPRDCLNYWIIEATHERYATAARDARHEALEEAAKFLEQQARELSVYRDQWPMRDENLRNATAIRALIDREPEPVVPDGPFTKGKTQTDGERDFDTYTIDAPGRGFVSRHYAAIEVHGNEGLRDRILALLNAAPTEPTPDPKKES